MIFFYKLILVKTTLKHRIKQAKKIKFLQTQIFFIFPNFSSDNITIIFPNSDLINTRISIYNYLGILVKQFNEIDLSGKSSINILTEEFTSGIYYCILSISI